MPAGRPRKYADNAAKQAAYRERHQESAPATGREMRAMLRDIHAWAKAAAADAPNSDAGMFAAAVVGASANETAFNVAEGFRKALHSEVQGERWIILPRSTGWPVCIEGRPKQIVGWFADRGAVVAAVYEHNQAIRGESDDAKICNL